MKVKGPKGELVARVPRRACAFTVDDGKVTVARANDEKHDARAARPDAGAAREHGDRRERRLHEDAGAAGRRLPRQQAGPKLSLAVGFSHPVEVTPPDGITLEVEGTTKLHVQGIDKELVGQVAANIRKLRPPEPYKGKGIRYQGERVRARPARPARQASR